MSLWESIKGAFAGRPVNAGAVEAILAAVDVPVQLGGGIRDRATLEGWLEKGVSRVILGTAAVRDPEFVRAAARAFPGRVAVGIDARAGRVAVTHLEGSRLIAEEPGRLVIEGRMAWAKSARLTPAKSVILRVLMLGFGRFFPDLVRRMLQAVLVTGRKDAPFTFRRTFTRTPGGWTVRDEVRPERGWQGIARAGISGFQTSTTTIMARVWAPDQAQPWHDCTDALAALPEGAPLIVERRFGGGQ